MATTSRFLKITGLFCKRTQSKRRYSAKETYNLKEPTNRSHPVLNKPYISAKKLCRSPTKSPPFLRKSPIKSPKHLEKSPKYLKKEPYRELYKRALHNLIFVAVPSTRSMYFYVFLKNRSEKSPIFLQKSPTAPGLCRCPQHTGNFRLCHVDFELSCTRLLQCVAVCCSVLQCVAVCFRCSAVCCSVLQ